jgi:hypothetical protein
MKDEVYGLDAVTELETIFVAECRKVMRREIYEAYGLWSILAEAYDSLIDDYAFIKGV